MSKTTTTERLQLTFAPESYPLRHHSVLEYGAKMVAVEFFSAEARERGKAITLYPADHARAEAYFSGDRAPNLPDDRARVTLNLWNFTSQQVEQETGGLVELAYLIIDERGYVTAGWET